MSQTAVIYGNGPSLLTAPIEHPRVHRIAINRADERVAYDTWVSADCRAVHMAIDRWDKGPGFTGKLMVVTGGALRQAGPFQINWPVEIHNGGGTSGGFAVKWAAMNNFRIIKLVGFADPRGQRFYESDDTIYPNRTRAYVQDIFRIMTMYPNPLYMFWDGEVYVDAEEEFARMNLEISE